MTTKKTATTKTTPKAEAPAGHVLVLNGEAVTLVPSAKAMMAISEAFGGIIPAIQRVQQFDVNAIGAVVHVGLDRPRLHAKEVEKTVRQVCAGNITDAATVVAGYLAEILSGPQKAEG